MVVVDESQTRESGGEDGSIYNVPFQTVVAMEVRSLVFRRWTGKMKTEDADSYTIYLLTIASFSPTKALLGIVGHHKRGAERKNRKM